MNSACIYPARALKNKLGKVYGIIQYNPDYHCNYLTWIDCSSIEEAKAGMEESLYQIELTQCPNLINDVSQIIGSLSGAKEWMSSIWTSRAYHKGLRTTALILSESSFHAHSSLLQDSNVNLARIRRRTFTSQQEAFAWFKQGSDTVSN